MRRLVLSFGAAAALVGGFLLLVGPARLARQLAGTDLATFAVGLGSVFAALVCWSEATRQLFRSTGTPLSRRRAFVAYGAGAFGKQVLPMGNAGGPAVMAYAFDREAGAGYARSLGVVVVAEFLSLVASLVLAVVGVALLLRSGAGGGVVRLLGGGVLLVALGLAALTVVVWYRRHHVGVAATAVARALAPLVARVSPGAAERLAPDRVDAGLRRYYETFDAAASDRRAVLVAFVLSQVGWVCFALPLYTGALALGVDLPLSLVLVLVPAAGLATVMPIPGGLGGLEAALGGLLTVLANVDVAAAAAVVVLFRLCTFWFFVLVSGVAASAATGRVRDLPVPDEATTVGDGGTQREPGDSRS